MSQFPPDAPQPPPYGVPQDAPQQGYPPPQAGYTQPPPGYPPPGYPQGGYMQPGMGGPMYLEPPNSPLAITSLICGIAAFVILPVIGSILALVFGYLAQNDIKKSQGRVGGKGMATAGIVLGYVGLGLGVLAVIFFIVVFSVVATNLPQYLPTATPLPTQ